MGDWNSEQGRYCCINKLNKHWHLISEKFGIRNIKVTKIIRNDWSDKHKT